MNERRKNTSIGKATVIAALAILTFNIQAQDKPTEVVEEKKPQWEGSAGMGFALTKGNSDTMLLNIRTDAEKKWLKNEMRLGASGTYGENEGDKNNEQAKGYGQYNRIFGDKDRWYGYGRIEAIYDAIADLDGRISIGPGIGYYFIKDDKDSLSGETGPSAVFEKYSGEDWESYLSLRIAERYEHKFNDKAKLWQSVEYLPDVTDTKRFIVNAEIGIETTITAAWGLRVSLQNSYNNEPSSGRDRNDLKLIAAVTYKF